MLQERRTLIEDLYKINGKAEIFNGEIVHEPPTGGAPSRASLEIAISLRAYEKRTQFGIAVADNAGFLVDLPNRQSFSPGAAFYTGNPPGMRFFEGAPVFATEVRSEGDYGPSAERRMAAKRRDCFAAGTLVVWDVDLLGEDVVRVYGAEDPENPTVFRRGTVANAEPAVPGWRMAVDDLFD